MLDLDRLVVASSNAGKLGELAEIMPPGIELVPQSQLGVEDAIEDGLSFAENATIKALNARNRTGLPALADDSGLEVDALGGAPGIRSARYAGENASDRDNVEKLLGALKGVPENERTARFRCVVVLALSADPSAAVVCEGVWEGSIQTEATGRSGFGYDPVFHVPTHGCSAAELDPGVKNRISHRARALRELMDMIYDSQEYRFGNKT